MNYIITSFIKSTYKIYLEQILDNFYSKINEVIVDYDETQFIEFFDSLQNNSDIETRTDRLLNIEDYLHQVYNEEAKSKLRTYSKHYRQLVDIKKNIIKYFSNIVENNFSYIIIDSNGRIFFRVGYVLKDNTITIEIKNNLNDSLVLSFNYISNSSHSNTKHFIIEELYS